MKATTSSSEGKPPKNQFQVPIWGPTSSGKTTYLAALYVALKNSDWDIWPDDARSFRFIDEHVQLLQEGRFGAPNAPSAPPAQYVLNITRLRPRHRFLGSDRMARLFLLRKRVMQLAIWDGAGDIYEDPVSKEETFYDLERYGRFYDSVRTAKGFLCLLDLGVDSREAYRQFIRRTLFMLRRDADGKVYRQIHRPVAWVLTKMDLPDRWPRRYSPRGYAVDVLGEELIQEIERTCVHCTWQAISSVGVVPDATGSRVEPNFERVDGANPSTRLKDPLHREPFHITEPLMWILEQFSWWWRHG